MKFRSHFFIFFILLIINFAICWYFVDASTFKIPSKVKFKSATKEEALVFKYNEASGTTKLEINMNDSFGNPIIEEFKADYFYGLYDYIYFRERFMDKTINKTNIYQLNRKMTKRTNSSYYNNNYSYIFGNYEDINEEKLNPWNKYIINEYKDKKFNIIYNIFDYSDSYNYKCRKKFISKYLK